MEAEATRTYFCLCYGTATSPRPGARASPIRRATRIAALHLRRRAEDAIVRASVSTHDASDPAGIAGGRTPPQTFMDSPFKY